MRPQVSYARSGGTNIAYQVLGEGPPDILFVPGFVSHIDLAWEEPFLSGFLRGLADLGRLIWFDKRGTGLSDPVESEPSTEDRQDDIRAVMDAARSHQAILFGVSEGASLCILFAVHQPDRVQSLILFAGFARLLRASGYPFGWSREFLDRFLQGLEDAWATGRGFEFANPSLAGDERYRAWFERYLRGAASPRMVRDLMRANTEIDLRRILDRIRVPTLVLHHLDDAWVPVGQSRYLAEHIPGARLVELPGVDHWPWIGDAAAVLDEISLFLTGRRQGRRRPSLGPASLTRREREIAALVRHGYSAHEIAERLTLSDRTVETHIANIYSKLGVGSRVELIRRAAEFGF